MFNVCTLVLEGLGGCFDQPGIMNHCLSASVPLFLNSFFGTSRKKKDQKCGMRDPSQKYHMSKYHVM